MSDRPPRARGARFTSIPRSLTGRRLVVIDDEAQNIDILRRLLVRAELGSVTATTDPVEGVALCRCRPPDLLLLDLHMPDLDGIGVLERLADLRSGEGHFPVIMLTGDDTAQARRTALRAGADDFLGKPFDPMEVGLRAEHLLRAHVMRLLLSEEGRLLRDLVAEQTQELEVARSEILDRLALATEFRDDETQRHARRIGRSAAILAHRLGCGDDWSDLLERAAPLHDIGKLGIPDAILLKPGPLTREERTEMERHTTIGARILEGGRSELLKLSEEIALSHHERWDGSGYPEGIVGDAAPLSARIVAVSDVFDALVHHRPYKAAWRSDDARRWIVDHAATLFDPDVIDAFVTVEDADLLAVSS